VDTSSKYACDADGVGRTYLYSGHGCSGTETSSTVLSDLFYNVTCNGVTCPYVIGREYEESSSGGSSGGTVDYEDGCSFTLTCDYGGGPSSIDYALGCDEQISGNRYYCNGDDIYLEYPSTLCGGDASSGFVFNEPMLSLYDDRCSIDDNGICDGGCGDTGLDTSDIECTADGNDFTETAVHINRCFTAEGTSGMNTCTVSDIVAKTYETTDCSGTSETLSAVEDSEGCLEVVVCSMASRWSVFSALAFVVVWIGALTM